MKLVFILVYVYTTFFGTHCKFRIQHSARATIQFSITDIESTVNFHLFEILLHFIHTLLSYTY